MQQVRPGLYRMPSTGPQTGVQMSLNKSKQVKDPFKALFASASDRERLQAIAVNSLSLDRKGDKSCIALIHEVISSVSSYTPINRRST